MPTKTQEITVYRTIEEVKKDRALTGLQAECDKIVEEVKNLPIKNAESEAILAQYGAEITKFKKRFEAKEKEFKADADQFLKAVREYLKPFKEAIESTKGTIKTKSIEYRRWAEERQAKANERAKKQAEKKGLPVTQANVEKTQDFGGAKVTYRDHWEVEIVDIDTLPDEFVIRTPDMAKLRKLASAGVESPKGAKFVKTSIPVYK